jgi:hypothetical protein
VAVSAKAAISEVRRRMVLLLGRKVIWRRW